MASEAAVSVALFCLVLSCSAQRFTLFNLSNPTYLRPDRQNEVVRVPEGIPLGEEGTQDSIFIWRNGIVSFGVSSSSANLSTPARDFSAVEAEFLVAPLWFQNVSQELVNSSVAWEVEKKGEEEYLLEFAKKEVNEYSRYRFGAEAEFSPTWAMIVSWNVSLTPDYAERERLCHEYFDCLCQEYRPYYYDYYYDDQNETEYDNGSSCPTDECFAAHGWSYHDIGYLSSLCRPDREFYYYTPPVEFQLVLATDQVDTHAIFIYQCREEFYYALDTFTFIYNHTTTGHRLGSLHDNYTCVSNDIPSLLRCDFIQCFSAFYSSTFYFFSATTLLRNLTSGFEQFRQLGNLEEGYDFIPFQLLTSDLLLGNSSGYYSNETNSTDSFSNTTATFKSLSRQLDGVSDVILHPGIGIGTTTQTKIYVGTNGIISFGRPFYFWYPQNFPTRYPWVRDTFVAAPFWQDVDIRSKGDIIYTTLFPGDSPEVFNTVNMFLSNQTNSSFKVDWLLVVDWLEVPIYPHYYVEKYSRYYSSSYRDRVLNDLNTFEAVIASSGPETYAIFTYHCERLTNPGLYRGAVIGYNLGGFEFENHAFSESLAVTRVACGNWPASNWFNLVYQLNSGEDAILQARRQCQALVALDESYISEKEIEEIQEKLSPCPCSIRNAWRDRNYRWDSNNFYCYYRRLPNPLTEQFDQYCCYDTNFEEGTWGALVKSGYRASGMAWLEQERFGRSLSETDREMRRFCCGLAGLCDVFLKRRPPNDCSGYRPPVWTWAWGDPHITTLDGNSYTFNGYGEFVMLRYGNSVDFQARMRPTPDTKATQFSSFVIGYRAGSRVEVDCGSPDPFCTTWYNGSNISSSLSTVNDSYYSSTDLIEVVRETETTVTVVLGAGLSLAVSYNKSVRIPSFQLNLDPGLSGSMVGLLGNKDGDKTNDMVYRNGTTINVATATDQQIFEFGSDWLISAPDESLFTYELDKGPLDFHDSDWMPTFTDDIISEASDEVKAACTPPGASEPLQQCLFDAVATGDVSVGMATANTLNENTQAMEESTNLPPVISSSVEGILTVSHSSPLTFTLSVTDDNDLSLSPSLVSPPPGATLSPSPGQPGSFIFTWQLPQLQEEEELSDVVVVVTDSRGAATIFSPQVQVCACLNGGNCSVEGATVFSDLLLTLSCICPPAWDGSYCQRDVDGCLEYACIDGVECMDIPAPGQGAECGPCPAGYTDDGNKCADIDECAGEGDLSPCQQVCTNTEGSYECSCNRGYVVDYSDPSRCIDFDECGSQLEDCEQVCTNTEGSFNCSCRFGFISDGPFCFPEQDCNADYTGCGSALCANISGAGPSCYCLPGYDLDASRTKCIDVDECAYGLCQHFCTNFPGTFLCSCSHGYKLGRDLVSCVDVDECREASVRGDRLCLAGEACLNLEGWYNCVCAPGLYPSFVDLNTSICGSPVVKEGFKEHSLIATFYTTTDEELLEEGGLDIMSRLLVQAVRETCSYKQCQVEGLGEETDSGLSKRDSHLAVFDPSRDLVQPVFDLSNLESGLGTVQVSFYLEVKLESGKVGVLSGTDTLAAVKAKADLFQEEFGSVGFSLASSPLPSETPVTGSPPVTQTDDDEEEELNATVVAVAAAAAAVVAVALSVSLALFLYFCVKWCRKRQDSDKDKRALLTEGVSWPDGKGGGAREMGEVPPQGPRMTEDPGKTIIVNENTA